MTTDAVRVPTAVKVGLAIAVLLVMNQIAPGIPAAIFALVGLYLILQNGDAVAAVLADAVDDLDSTLRRRSSGGPPAQPA